MIRQWISGAAALLVLFNVACQSGGSTSTKTTKKDSAEVRADDHQHGVGSQDPQGADGATYTCPMHPQIVQSTPGACPICGMDLVAVVNKGEKATELQLSVRQIQLAGITVRSVTSATIGNATVLNGRLAADEEQTNVISSRVAGRIERLYVKETGQSIRKGQVLYEIYSESLLTDQQEYLMALRQEQELGPSEARYRQFRQAAEHKLRLYGMSPAQIEQLGRSQAVQPRIPVIAPASGTVTEIAASEGQYVAEGSLLYKLVNLARLWVEADLYPAEAGYVKVGDQVPIEVVGYEGADGATAPPLTARVSFINPELRAGSQVVVMRAVLPNVAGRFQPGQQVRVSIRHGVSRGLTLPVDAVVRAGSGAVVFVQPAPGVFQARRVQTGIETDQQVSVTKGLEGSEQVAMSGAYLLYSELILKKGINPILAGLENEGAQSTPTTASDPAPTAAPARGPAPAKGHPVAARFRRQLSDVYKASLTLTEALIASNADQAKATAGRVKQALAGVEMSLVTADAHTEWMSQFTAMNTALKTITSTGDLTQQRTAYARFEDALYRSVKSFGVLDQPVYRQYCPMAVNNQGAYWLSNKKPIRNPYFGEQMLTCGETKETILSTP